MKYDIYLFFPAIDSVQCCRQTYLKLNTSCSLQKAVVKVNWIGYISNLHYMILCVLYHVQQ